MEGITGDDDRSQLFLTRVQPSLVLDSHGAPQDVAGALVPGRWEEDTLTLGLFPGSQVLLLFLGDPVHRECIAGWPVAEGRWIFVSASGTLTDASTAQLECCDDKPGDTRCPSHVGELEKIEDLINVSGMLKWIEQSQKVAESICVNEGLESSEPDRRS